MSERPPFNVRDLSTKSALQLTVWPDQPERHELAARALMAFGTAEQGEALHALGHDFISYLQFQSADLEVAAYPGLDGYRITHSVLGECTAAGRHVDKRSVRILTQRRNGPVLRGFGDSEHAHEITAVFSHLTAAEWERLANQLGWDPQNLGRANAPGIAFYPEADPEMTLLAPPYWT